MTSKGPDVARAQRERAGVAIAILGAVLIARMTLEPTGAGPGLPRWCLVCGEQGLQDVVLNLVLFVPLGAGLGLTRLRASRGVAIALAITLAVELLQVRVVAGRDASLSDLLTNTAGGAIGIALARTRRVLLAPTKRTAGRLATAALGAWLGLLTFTGWAFQPSIPPATAYYGQWARGFPGFARFPGRVLAATLDGAEVPDNHIPQSSRVREMLLGVRPALRATVIGGGVLRPGRTAPIVSIAHPDQFVVVTLEQEGRDVLFRLRTRAADARLRMPGARARGVFGGAAGRPTRPGDTLRVVGMARPGRLRVDVSTLDGSPVAAGELRLSPGLGWSLLWPFASPSVVMLAVISAGWLAALAAPVAFWTRRAAGAATTRGGLLLAAVLGGGLVLPSLLWPIPLADAAQWLGCTAGAIGGWWLGGRLAS